MFSGLNQTDDTVRATEKLVKLRGSGKTPVWLPLVGHE